MAGYPRLLSPGRIGTLELKNWLCQTAMGTVVMGGHILTAQTACIQIDRQVARGDGLLDVYIDKNDPFGRIKQWQVINSTTCHRLCIDLFVRLNGGVVVQATPWLQAHQRYIRTRLPFPQASRTGRDLSS